MNTLKNYVDYKLSHADKFESAEEYPLVMENCKRHKKMKQLQIYGNTVQDGTPTPDAPIDVQSVGELVTDTTDTNYGKYKMPVVTRGKNFIQFPYAYMSVTHNGVTFTVNDDGTITANGTATGGTAYIVIADFGTNPIPLGTYTISGTVKDTYIMFSGIDVASANGSSHTFTITKEQKQNRLTCCVYPGKTVNNAIFKPMIEAGTQATEYERYVEPITTNIFLNEPLRKLGDYADYIDFKENKVVRKCCKRYLNDYTDWGIVAIDITGLYSFWAKDYTIVPNSNNSALNWKYDIAKSNIFPVYTHTEITKEPFGIFTHSYGSNVRINIPRDYIYENSVAALSQWLNIYNPYMIRILAEPAEENIALDLPKLNAKTTIIEVGTILAPSNSYGKYIKK